MQSSEKIYLVLDLIEGGHTLDDILLNAPLQRDGWRHLSEKSARYYFLQIVHGLRHCHERGVIHRDLKPENGSDSPPVPVPVPTAPPPPLPFRRGAPLRAHFFS